MQGSPIAVISSSKILGSPPYEKEDYEAFKEAVRVVCARLDVQYVMDKDSESTIEFTRVIWAKDSLDITHQVADELTK